MLNRETAEDLPEWLQDTFFMMVVSNSCVNPIVYGSYAINCKQNCKLLACWGKDSVNKNMSKLHLLYFTLVFFNFYFLVNFIIAFELFQ